MTVAPAVPHPRVIAGAVAVVAAALAGTAEPAAALQPATVLESAWAVEDPGVDDLGEVITNIRNWLMGLLVALATLLLTIGGVRYLLAGGDPGEVARAKDTLKYAALGFGVAILAPLLVEILRGFVGQS